MCSGNTDPLAATARRVMVRAAGRARGRQAGVADSVDSGSFDRCARRHSPATDAPLSGVAKGATCISPSVTARPPLQPKRAAAARASRSVAHRRSFSTPSDSSSLPWHTATARLHTSQPLEGHCMISRSTLAAAARVIEYAAARPIVLSAGLIPPTKSAAEGAEAGNTPRGQGQLPRVPATASVERNRRSAKKSSFKIAQ